MTRPTLTLYGVWLWLQVPKPLPRWGHLLLWCSVPYLVRAFVFGR